jgi:hypothetical protein
VCLAPRAGLALIISIALAASSLALAQDQPAATSERATTPTAPAASRSGTIELLTAKERLSEKWTDEQRVDNCKVPLDKRGPKPRPDTCQTVPSE